MTTACTPTLRGPLAVACPTCGEGAGFACRTLGELSGRVGRLTSPHADRRALASARRTGRGARSRHLRVV